MQEQKQQEIGHVTGQKQMTGQKIGIVGGGLMGHGIAYLFAAAGHTSRSSSRPPSFAHRCRNDCTRSPIFSTTIRR